MRKGTHSDTPPNTMSIWSILQMCLLQPFLERGVPLNLLEKLEFSREEILSQAVALLKRRQDLDVAFSIVNYVDKAELKQDLIDAVVDAYFKTPDRLEDRISLALMTDPVVVSSGHTFQRNSVFDGNKLKVSTCPVTRQALQSQAYPNFFVKQEIDAWAEQRRKFNRAVTERGFSSLRTSLARHLADVVSKHAGEAGLYLALKLDMGFTGNFEVDTLSYMTRTLTSRDLMVDERQCIESLIALAISGAPEESMTRLCTLANTISTTLKTKKVHQKNRQAVALSLMRVATSILELESQLGMLFDKELGEGIRMVLSQCDLQNSYEILFGKPCCTQSTTCAAFQRGSFSIAQVYLDRQSEAYVPLVMYTAGQPIDLLTVTTMWKDQLWGNKKGEARFAIYRQREGVSVTPQVVTQHPVANENEPLQLYAHDSGNDHSDSSVEGIYRQLAVTPLGVMQPPVPNESEESVSEQSVSRSSPTTRVEPIFTRNLFGVFGESGPRERTEVSWSADSEILSMIQPGDHISIEGKVGGGGGHALEFSGFRFDVISRAKGSPKTPEFLVPLLLFSPF
ncbi:MAG: hypothetical protein KVP17_004638 [Porospora cf. gigantea B]|uniref:uncharacterized protein n=1 Tax=Porospora cf. gigantea B TaxID=2853592 RepID=UPI0035718104|nr:MAG: hypothetical protein KVP17_004638 [Porospora cf. gigantea B]